MEEITLSNIEDKRHEINKWIDQHPYDLLVKDDVLLLAGRNPNYLDEMYGRAFIDDTLAKVNTLQMIYG